MIDCKNLYFVHGISHLKCFQMNLQHANATPDIVSSYNISWPVFFQQFFVYFGEVKGAERAL